jgi:hypothetical protein
MVRERNSRSGISGRCAVACRTTKPARSTTDSAPRPRAWPELGGWLHDGVDGEHQSAGDEDCAGDVGALAHPDAPVVGDEPDSEHGCGDPDRDVDQEDPVPVDGLRQDPARDEPDRTTCRGDEAVDTKCLRLLPRLGEHRDDHPQDDRRGERTADALQEARRDEYLLALRGSAQQRGAGEQAQPTEEHSSAADQVAEPAGQEQ